MAVAGDNLDSTILTNLDTQPIQVPSAGEGGPGMFKNLDDYAIATTSITSTSAYRMARFPTNAKVKRVWLYTKGLDSSASQTLTLDANVAFSDSTFDGTNVNLQAQIPVSTGTGAVVAPATYTGANKLFGSALTVAASGAFKFQDITHANTYTPVLKAQPMWAVLGGSGAATASVLSAGGGFAQGSNGIIQDPGGFFDMYVVAAANPATAATGTIGIEVDYVI